MSLLKSEWPLFVHSESHFNTAWRTWQSHHCQLADETQDLFVQISSLIKPLLPTLETTRGFVTSFEMPSKTLYHDSYINQQLRRNSLLLSPIRLAEAVPEIHASQNRIQLYWSYQPTCAENIEYVRSQFTALCAELL